MRIDIRHVEAQDVSDIKGILTDESVMLGTMRLPHVANANVEARIKSGPGDYKLVAEVDGCVVGICFMSTEPNVPRHNHVGQIDLLAVREDFQGNGIAKALLGAMLDLCDNWLQLERTGLLVWSDNTHALELYEAFGFEKEGVIRRYARRPGGFADAVMMGRLSDRVSAASVRTSNHVVHAP
ncbi:MULTISPECIES: GNAT family N-acetyltransferase [unclassified Ruegeria]|uniref:GNAT family N-acetyltransferase n=1 Tax=unclassified Ruegeria TaxID=2625375 RepID=UPI0014890410|nr:MULTISPECIES: GNAT family N-acetyltransferase [unclassified Ruegeria]